MTPMLQRIYGSEGGSELLDVLMKYLWVLFSCSLALLPNHVLDRLVELILFLTPIQLQGYGIDEPASHTYQSDTAGYRI